MGQASLLNHVNEVPLSRFESRLELMTTSQHESRWHGPFLGNPVVVLQGIIYYACQINIVLCTKPGVSSQAK